MKNGLYKIGELARITGLTTRTLRYYEELELITSRRTAGGQRVYDVSSLKRLNLIESLKIAGFSLQEIRHVLLDWRDCADGREAAEKLLTILESKHREVSKTVDALTNIKNQLEASIELLDNCLSCPEKPAPDLCGQCDAPGEEGRRSHLIDEIMRNT